MHLNPDKERKKDNLRELVKTLLDKRDLDTLMSFTYADMQELFCSILFMRARGTDAIDNIYYDFLYSYQINRGAPFFRLAGSVMYEQAFRLSQYGTTEAFSLCDPKFTWVIKPIDVEIEEEFIELPREAGSDAATSKMPCVSRVNNPEKENSKELDLLLKDIYQTFTKTINVLLLGTGESGKTTICKQMRIIHIKGFTEEEKLEKVPFIKQNVHESIFCIVRASSVINPPVEIRDSKAKESAEYILRIGADPPATWTNEYVQHVKTLWGDPNIQTVFQRSNEYQLIDSAQQFLDRIDEISQENYVPTLQDILFCRITTITISQTNFSVKVNKRYGGGYANFCMYDVGGQRGHRRKWISVFDGGIQVILFLIAISDFDQTLREDEKVNRLKESFRVYEDMFWSRFVRGVGFIVFLNKQDLLKKKIESGRKVEKYFPEYASYKQTFGMTKDSEYETVKSFVKHKILTISKAIPGEEPTTTERHVMKDLKVIEMDEDRQVYIHYTTATDTDSIKLVFNDVLDLIIGINLKSIAAI